MQQVITQTQARAVLNGRAPLIPVEYETACKALAACITLDEAKYWDNKADALAAWAKIYHSPDAERKAKQLKLHAFRRMGELAGELRPRKTLKGTAKGKGTLPGPVSLLKESGLNRREATAARRLSCLNRTEFERFVSMPRPPSPLTVERVTGGGTDAWKILSGNAGLKALRSFARGNSAAGMARALTPDEAKVVHDMTIEVIEWLDELDRCLSARTGAK
jgi:hypothetical protein